MQFRDRYDAGRQLAVKLMAFANRSDVLVLGLPRAGMPVAFEVAQALHAPLDVWIVRKLGVPGQPDMAMGAIAPGGIVVLNDSLIKRLYIPDVVVTRAIANEEQELAAREHLFRGDRPALGVHDRVVILIDDGLATGATMHAAVRALRKQNPARIVVAVPVGAAPVLAEFEGEADEMVSVAIPTSLLAISYWYKHFAPVTRREVLDLLVQAQQ